jgi:hypothetical protein
MIFARFWTAPLMNEVQVAAKELGAASALSASSTASRPSCAADLRAAPSVASRRGARPPGNAADPNTWSGISRLNLFDALIGSRIHLSK